MADPIAMIQAAVATSGLEIFDLEMPSANGGTLKVFLALPGGKTTGITHDHCLAVGRKLNQMPELDECFPAGYNLEVSSPGINRKLRTEKHFETAVQERVKVLVQGAFAEAQKLTAKAGRSFDVVGKILAVERSQSEVVVRLAVEDTQRSKKRALKDQQVVELAIPFREIISAKVDFDFNQPTQE